VAKLLEAFWPNAILKPTADSRKKNHMTNNLKTSLEFVAPEEVRDVTEVQVQKEFEKNLEKLDDTGLIHIGSFIPIGVGVMDTLAIDSDGKPVILEFKKSNANSRDALIQGMDYWSYCTRHFNQLKNIIESKLKDTSKKLGAEISNEFRLIIVAGDFDERLLRAASALACEVMLLSYRLLKQDNKVLIIPHPRLISSKLDRPEPKPPKKLDDHFKGKERLRPLYDQLIEQLKKMQVPFHVNEQPQDYIGLAGDKKQYAALNIKNKWIRVDLSLNFLEAQYPGYKLWSEGVNTGYLHFADVTQLTEVAAVIERAYKKSHLQSEANESGS
jgi:hypothetical protein